MGVIEAHESCLKGLDSAPFECSIPRLNKRQSSIELLLSMSPLHDHMGLIVGAISVGSDVTELKKMSDIELARAAAAVEKMTAERHLAYMNHELRNLLFGQHGNLKLVADTLETLEREAARQCPPL